MASISKSSDGEAVDYFKLLSRSKTSQYYRFEGFDGEKQRIKNMSNILTRSKTNAKAGLPVGDENLGRVLSKISHFLK